MILENKKTFVRGCFGQFGLEGLPVTFGITSSKKEEVLSKMPKNKLENRISKRTQETAMPLKASIQSWNSTEGRDHSHTQRSMSSFHCGVHHPAPGGSGPQLNSTAWTRLHEKSEEQENGAVVLLDSSARNQTCSPIKLKASFIFSWRVWFKERFFLYERKLQGVSKREVHCGEFGLLPALLVSKVKWIPKPEALKRDL